MATNISWATATDIGTAIPYVFLQTDIRNLAGQNDTVYYKFTAPDGAVVMTARGYSGSPYSPWIRPFHHSDLINPILDIVGPQQAPIQFPVIPGELYYLKFTPDLLNTPGPAEVLRVQLDLAPQSAFPTGNFLIFDDTDGFPLAVVSHLVDYTTTGFIKDMAAGEGGDILANGVIAAENRDDATIHVYGPQLNLISTLAAGGYAFIRRCTLAQNFYVGIIQAVPNPPLVKTINSLGAYGPVSWSLIGSTTLNAIAPSNDEKTLYYSQNANAEPIKRWDLENDVALANLVAGIAANRVVDILYLDDDTIAALYWNGATKVATLKIYDTTGATLMTYVVPAQGDATWPRMGWALDNPNSVWIWSHDTDGLETFRNVKCSDGSILGTRFHQRFQEGQSQQLVADPMYNHGISGSCPFIVNTINRLSTVEGGIYFINPNKTTGGGTGKHDSYYNDLELKIPNPIWRTAFLGE